jgi:hypothetical protein
MKSLMDRSLVALDVGTLKMLRRRRARVVLPDELGPERPMIRERFCAVWWSDIVRVYGQVEKPRGLDWKPALWFPSQGWLYCTFGGDHISHESGGTLKWTDNGIEWENLKWLRFRELWKTVETKTPSMKVPINPFLALAPSGHSLEPLTDYGRDVVVILG